MRVSGFVLVLLQNTTSKDKRAKNIVSKTIHKPSPINMCLEDRNNRDNRQE